MELFTLVLVLTIFVEVTLLLTKNTTTTATLRPNRKIYVDTSALMDPRLLAVAETGFLSGDIIIPRSVTHELQLLADGKDSDKRLRARAGLETVRSLERVVYFSTSILDDDLDHTPVDNRLLDLAKKTHGLILTNDYNLQKVAETEHIDILNLNMLSLALRNEYLPGEKTKLRIVAQGSNPHQGIGYLHDGTMVVVDRASSKVGQEIDIEFIRLNQTPSGVMMFARPAAPQSNHSNAPQPPRVTSASRVSSRAERPHLRRRNKR